jgi:hypothetical protein
MGGWAVLHEIRSEFAQIMTCVYLLAAGPGPWSLDALLQRRRRGKTALESSARGLEYGELVGVAPSAARPLRAGR